MINWSSVGTGLRLAIAFSDGDNDYPMKDIYMIAFHPFSKTPPDQNINAIERRGATRTVLYQSGGMQSSTNRKPVTKGSILRIQNELSYLYGEIPVR